MADVSVVVPSAVSDKRSLSAQKVGRNSRAPFHTLLVELFVEILKIALFLPEDQTYYQRMLPLRFVCSRWNTVMNSTPALWYLLRIECPVNRSLVLMILKNSQQHLLDITFGMRGEVSDWYIKQLAKEAHRWRNFEFVILSYEPRHRQLFSSPMPFLRLLGLSRAFKWERHCLDISIVAPRLRNVHLSGVSLPWSSFKYTPTNMQLLSIQDQQTNAPSLNLLSQMIQSSPSLTNLMVDNCDIPITSTSPRVLSLPKLEELDINRMSASFLIWFVDHIRTPQPERWRYLTLCCTDSEGAESATRAAGRGATWLLPVLSKLELHSVSCVFRGTTSVDFIWRDEGHAQPILLRVETSTITAQEKMEICRRVLRIINPAETSLMITVESNETPSQLRALLLGAASCLQNLTTLELGNSIAVQWALPAAMEILGEPDATGKWLFPNLAYCTINAWSERQKANSAGVLKLIRRRWAQPESGVNELHGLLIPPVTDAARTEIKRLLPATTVYERAGWDTRLQK